MSVAGLVSVAKTITKDGPWYPGPEFKAPLKAIGPIDLAMFFDAQKVNPGNFALIDCQDDDDNAKVVFSGAYQMSIAGAQDAIKFFQQPGRANTTSMANLQRVDLVIFYCVHGAIRSPAAMYSYKKYLGQKNQNVLLLEGGIEGFKTKFPKHAKLVKRTPKLPKPKGDLDTMPTS